MLLIRVTTTKVTVKQADTVNAGEYNINTCEFEFDKEYDNLVKRAVFSNIEGRSHLVEILDNKVIIPEEVLRLAGITTIGVYGYENEGNNLKLRYSPEPATFEIKEGSYVENASEATPAKSIKDMIDEYNSNASNKIDEFNSNVFNKIVEFNENSIAKTNEFDMHASDKVKEFNNNALDKIEELNENADNRKKELQAISDTARDFVSAVTFTTIEQNFETGNLEVNNQDSLGNMGFQFNYETGNLEVDINA